MLGLYKFYWDCGRMGYLEGLFITDDKEIDELIGKYIYFGGVLSKHSEIYGNIEIDDIELVTKNLEVITVLKEAFNGNTISGYNPFDYLSDVESDE